MSNMYVGLLEIIGSDLLIIYLSTFITIQAGEAIKYKVGQLKADQSTIDEFNLLKHKTRAFNNTELLSYMIGATKEKLAGRQH